MNYINKRFQTCFVSGLILIIERISFAFGSAITRLKTCHDFNNNLVAIVFVRLRPPKHRKINP